MASEIPAWVQVTAVGVNGLSGAAIGYACLNPLQPLQAMAISAISNLISQVVAPLFSECVFGETPLKNEILRLYVVSHIVTVPLVTWLVTACLGISLSGPGFVILTIANLAAAVLGLDAAELFSRGTSIEWNLE